MVRGNGSNANVHDSFGGDVLVEALELEAFLLLSEERKKKQGKVFESQKSERSEEEKTHGVSFFVSEDS